MALRPPLPPRRSVPPPPRRAAPSSPEQAEFSNATKGIAARIASLQLNEVGRSPMVGKPGRNVPVTPEQEEEEIEVFPQKSRRPTWDDIKARGEDYVQAISRKPPPIPSSTPPAAAPARRLPPRLARLPTPPPEPEPEPEPVVEIEEASAGCMKCYDFSFVDTHAAQFPRETVASLDQLAYDLTSPWESETEKFRAIFTWLHHNIAYDADAFFCGNVQASTPESTLRSGLAVCDGYAGLFKSLADRAGLQAMRVGGHGKGFGYVPTEEGGPVPQYQGNHAWNCALMDGEWRLVDSCWGAGAVSTEGYIKGFNPSWFTFTNAQFGKRHYPEDPSYQLIPEEDGGPISWEEYILEEEGPQIFSSFHTNNFSPSFLQPSTKYIQSGTWVIFYLFKVCEHLSTDDADNYVAFISLPDQSRHPLTFNAESGGWSANVYIPDGGEISLYYVTEVSGQDAKGLGVKAFNAAIGRKAMQFGGLCRWTAI